MRSHPIRRQATLATMAFVLGTAVHAEPGPAGTALEYGPLAPTQPVFGATRNPSGAAADDRHRFRAGIIGLGGGYELGEADNFFQESESLIDNIEQLQQDFDHVQDEDDAVDVAEALRGLEGDGNALLNAFAQDGYAKAGVAGNLPATPLVFGSERLDGTFTLNARSSVQGRAGILHRPDSLDLLPGEGPFDEDKVDYDETDGTIRYDGEEVERPDFAEDTALDVRGGRLDTLSLGYGRPVTAVGGGQLFAGVTASYYRAELSRVAIAFQELEGDDEFDDVAEDRFDENRHTDSDLGVDLGVTWVGKRFRFGGTVQNVNEPSFRFPCEGESCNILADHGEDDTRFTMERQFTLEGAVHSDNRHWLAAASVETRTVSDIAGDEYQWASLAAGYAPDSFWIPGFRLGYRTSISGVDISYVSGGLTLFRMVHLDVAASTDTVEMDGDEVPRSVHASLGVEFSF